MSDTGHEGSCLFALTGLLDTYGAAESNAVLLADKEETWIFEIYGGHTAAASVMGEAMGAIIPSFYFFGGKVEQLKYVRTRMEAKVIAKVCGNGSSEMLSYIASSVVGMLYNYQLNKLAGEDGINAYGTLMYLGIVFLCIFTGFDMEAVPVIGYQYGAGNS